MGDLVTYGKNMQNNMFVFIFILIILDPDEHLFSPLPIAAYQVLSKFILYKKKILLHIFAF